jgi:hypothetical protein
MRISLPVVLAVGGFLFASQAPALAQAQSGLTLTPNPPYTPQWIAPWAAGPRPYYDYYYRGAHGYRARHREWLVSPRLGQQG